MDALRYNLLSTGGHVIVAERFRMQGHGLSAPLRCRVSPTVSRTEHAAVATVLYIEQGAHGVHPPWLRTKLAAGLAAHAAGSLANGVCRCGVATRYFE